MGHSQLTESLPVKVSIFAEASGHDAGMYANVVGKSFNAAFAQLAVEESFVFGGRDEMIGGKLIGGLFMLVGGIGFVKGDEGGLLAVAEEEMADLMKKGEPEYVGVSSTWTDGYDGFFWCQPFADAVGIGALKVGQDDEGDATVGAGLLEVGDEF